MMTVILAPVRLLRTVRLTGIAVLLACAPALAGSGQAYEFRLDDVNPRSATHGETLELTDLVGGRGLVLHFTASWCGFCRKELPLLQELHAEGRIPIAFVAMDENGELDGMLIVAERSGLTAPLFHVPSAKVPMMERHYRYDVLPATFIIDDEGTIRDFHQGVDSRDKLLERVDAVIQRASGGGARSRAAAAR